MEQVSQAHPQTQIAQLLLILTLSVHKITFTSAKYHLKDMNFFSLMPP